MVGWHHQLNMSLSKLREMGKDREAWRAAVRGVAKKLAMTEQLNKHPRVQKLTILKVPHEFIVYVWFFLLILNISRISESKLFSFLIFCFKTPSVLSPELLQISPTWFLCFYPWFSIGSFSKQHPEWSLANRSQLFPFLYSNPSMTYHLT